MEVGRVEALDNRPGGEPAPAAPSRPPQWGSPFNLPPSSAVERTPEEQADQDELRAVLLQQLAERKKPAAIPQPVFLDGPPRPAAPSPPPPQVPAPAVPAPAGPIFDPDTLYRPRSEGRPIEPYEMPGGGLVYPHPLSGAERKYVNAQVALNLDRLYAGREEPRTDEERGLRAFERALDAEILGNIWHAVVCAKDGPQDGAARVFRDDHAEPFYVNEGWEEAAQAIAALSRSYSEGRSPLEALREAWSPFFAATRTMLDSCASQLEAVSWPATEEPSSVAEVRATLRSCATSMQPLTQPSGWGTGEVLQVAGAMKRG